MRLLLVFNPHAGAGRAARLLPGIRSALEGFAALDVLKTGGAGDATRLVAAADLSSYDGLIATGGDGTLFEVLNGLYTHDKAQRIHLAWSLSARVMHFRGTSACYRATGKKQWA